MNSQDPLLSKLGCETPLPTGGEQKKDLSTARPSAANSETHPVREPSAELVSRLPKIVHFRELCRCGDEVWIENEGQLYRLRRTRQGKLILTK